MRFSALFASIVLACATQAVPANAQGIAKGAVAIEKLKALPDGYNGPRTSSTGIELEAGQIFVFGRELDPDERLKNLFSYDEKKREAEKNYISSIGSDSVQGEKYLEELYQLFISRENRLGRGIDWAITPRTKQLIKGYYISSNGSYQLCWIPEKYVQLFDLPYADKDWEPWIEVGKKNNNYRWKSTVVTAARGSIASNTKIKNKTKNMLIEKLNQIEAKATSYERTEETRMQEDAKKQVEAKQDDETKKIEERKSWEPMIEDDIRKNTFKGDDIVALAKALDIEKGEFESTVAYHERLENIVRKKDRFMFVKTIDPQIYDADKEQFEIYIDIPTIEIFKLSQQFNNQHEAQNAYGAKVIVNDEGSIIYSVDIIHKDFEEITKFSTFLEHLYKKYNLKISSKDAPNYNNKFKLLFIVKMTPNEDKKYYSPNLYYRNDSVVSNATVSDPVRRIVVKKIISAKLEEIWIYNEFDGKVMKKFPQDQYNFFKSK